jgi:hypothetical protein
MVIILAIFIILSSKSYKPIMLQAGQEPLAVYGPGGISESFFMGEAFAKLFE